MVFPGPTTQACSGTASMGCCCTSMTPEGVAATGDGRPGTWSIMGTNLVFLHKGPPDNTTMRQYCVTGNILKMRSEYGEIDTYQRM